MAVASQDVTIEEVRTQIRFAYRGAIYELRLIKDRFEISGELGSAKGEFYFDDGEPYLVLEDAGENEELLNLAAAAMQQLGEGAREGGKIAARPDVVGDPLLPN